MGFRNHCARAVAEPCASDKEGAEPVLTGIPPDRGSGTDKKNKDNAGSGVEFCCFFFVLFLAFTDGLACFEFLII